MEKQLSIRSKIVITAKGRGLPARHMPIYGVKVLLAGRFEYRAMAFFHTEAMAGGSVMG